MSIYQKNYPTSAGRRSIFVGENSGAIGAEGAVDQRVGARVGAGVQEEELLDAIVDLVVRVGSNPEPEKQKPCCETCLDYDDVTV